MKLELTDRQFRLLLDMAYIGNWVLNSTRGEDRIVEYDEVESRLFFECVRNGMDSLAEFRDGTVQPSRAFAAGGIHEAIMDYEDAVFFDILAEALARRDMQAEGVSQDDMTALEERMNEYTEEFERNGMDHLSVDLS
ncbi:MAG: hypothetical protein IK141_00340 [Clostridia bacterium]|nr:hypothetical protein [Clostridia bacterium]